MSNSKKKRNRNSKYTAPYKSTNYLESGSSVPILWAGSSINQEGTYTNLEQPVNRGDYSYTEQPGGSLVQFNQKDTNSLASNNSNGFNFGNLQQSGAYNTIGSTASGIFASRAASADNSNDKIYNTSMAVTSKAGPVGAVIGGVTAVGDSIGDPIRKRVAATDEQGNVKNTKDFLGANTVGSLTNPAKSMIDTWNSKASTGQKILETLTGGIAGGLRRKRETESAAKAQIAETERLESERIANERAIREAEQKRVAGINRVNNMEIDSRYLNTSNQSFAEGGDITEYNGYRHEDGGLNLGQAEVEDGETRGMPNTSTKDYIFSDRLKTLDNKTTFAMKSKNISKKYSLRPWDHISKGAESRELEQLSKENDIARKFNELGEAVKAYGGNIDKLRPKVLESMNEGNFNSMGRPLSYGGELKTTDTNDAQYAKGGWIQKAINPKHKGYCTPLSKSTCNGHRRALALRFKHGDLSKKTYGGNLYPNGGKLLEPTDAGYKDDPVVDEINSYGDINNEKLYEDPEKVGRYMTVLMHANSGNKAVVSDLSKAYIHNYNKRYGKTKGFYYDPDKPSLHIVYPDENIKRYKELSTLYNPVQSNTQKVQSRSLGDSASFGVKAKGGNIYAFGDYIANNPELINAGVQGVVQSLRSRKINKLQPNTLDYTPISYLNESAYAAPVSNMAYRPTRNTEQIRGINTAYKGAEKAASEYSDSGDYLNRMTAIGSAKANNLGQTWENYYNNEANRRMQVDQFNKGIQGQNMSRASEIAIRNKMIEEANIKNKLMTQEYANAEKDALTSLKLQNYGDWSNYLTGTANDLAKKNAYEDMMTVEGTRSPQYEFYKDKKGRLKSRLRPKAAV